MRKPKSRLGLHRDLHGAGLRNNFGGQNRKIFYFFIAQIGSKRLPTSSTSFFSPKIDQFDPIGAQYEACIVSCSCVLHTPCSEKCYFLRTKMPLNQFFTPGFSNIPPTHIKQHYNLCIIEFWLSDERRWYSHYRAGVAPYSALAAEGAEVTPVEQKLMGIAEVHLKGIPDHTT